MQYLIRNPVKVFRFKWILRAYYEEGAAASQTKRTVAQPPLFRRRLKPCELDRNNAFF